MEYNNTKTNLNCNWGTSISPAIIFDLQQYQTTLGTHLHATISMSDEFISGQVPMYFLDNCNIGYKPQNSFTLTSGTIAYAEAISTKTNLSSMVGKADVICPELYATSSCGTIDITVRNINTGTTVQSFSVTLSKNPNSNVPYIFTSYSATSNASSLMYVYKQATQSNASGKFGDLNLLALVFIFWTAGANAQLCPCEDSDIINSFNTKLWI